MLSALSHVINKEIRAISKSENDSPAIKGSAITLIVNFAGYVTIGNRGVSYATQSILV